MLLRSREYLNGVVMGICVSPFRNVFGSREVPFLKSLSQMMMGGDKFAISPEEYVFAAIAIYLDILNLFLRILRIMSLAKGK